MLAVRTPQEGKAPDRVSAAGEALELPQDKARQRPAQGVQPLLQLA